MIKSKEELKSAIEKAESHKMDEGLRVLVCAGTGCVANGSLEVFSALQEEVADLDLPVKVGLMEENDVTIKISGCHGFCEQGPLVKMQPGGLLYTAVTVDDVKDIVEDTIIAGNIIEDLIFEGPDKNKYSEEEEIPFYANQDRITLKNCGNIDPEDIQDYFAVGGYSALSKALFQMTPEEVCKEVLDSGLRGRGGAGFPTGRKWLFTRQAEGDQKYVIVNGDEGDPGAFMDRSIMEGD
ncbi:MAG: NAD(P)H-dependent oxidoreductase subunit E, partial [Halanaerobiales bacterium]